MFWACSPRSVTGRETGTEFEGARSVEVGKESVETMLPLRALNGQDRAGTLLYDAMGRGAEEGEIQGIPTAHP
jgi:hypothetical protein